jgi:nanoRNase/pAp phosphatase (c-di-AMP/oligoRNAs hydrolase)
MNQGKEEYTVRSVQYKEHIDFDCIAPGERVVFLDFTPQLEDVKRLFQIEGVSIAIYDHHPVQELHDEILSYAYSPLVNRTCVSVLDAKAWGCVGLMLSKGHLDSSFDGNVFQHIGMRDVWHFEVNTEAICRGAQALAPLPAYDHDFFAWAISVRNLTYNRCLEIGEILVKEMRTEVAKDMLSVREWEICDTTDEVLMVYGCFSNRNVSELGNEIAKVHGLAVVFMIVGDRLQMSFRGEGAREAAMMFGGGGHWMAAGASSQKWEIEAERLTLK